MSVTVFSFQRESFNGSRLPPGIRTIPLGQVEHGKYLRRLARLPRALWVLLTHRRVLGDATTIYAFGPDCLVLSVAASFVGALGRRCVVYELADVREGMLRPSIGAAFLRLMERLALRRVIRAVVTSPSYRDEYLSAMQKFPSSSIAVVENKLMPPLPSPREDPVSSDARPLKIGWFGLLRFQESWDLLFRLAEQCGESVTVYVRGHPMMLRGFQARVGALANLNYGGPYASPDDLAAIYSKIDVSWMVYGVGNNKQRKWMLPNRYFEAVYYRVPIIAARGSLLGARVEDLGIGWTVDVAHPEHAIEFVRGLSRADLDAARARLATIPREYAVGEDDNLSLIQNLCRGPLARTVA